MTRLVGPQRASQTDQNVRFAGEDTRVAHLEQNELREVEKLREEFISSISHELRTPLTSIIGYLELLRTEETEPLNQREQRESLAIIGRNVERLRRLIDDLLLEAELRQGRLELTLTDVELGALTEHAVTAAQPRAKAAGLVLAVERGGQTVVQGDRIRLEELVDNLISNAIKFTPEGGTVTVRAFNRDDKVVVEVADTGIGIPGDERAQLFERFFRSSTARAQQIPGVGLGLHIARAITKAHGGRISVTDNQDDGTVFRVELEPACRLAVRCLQCEFKYPLSRRVRKVLQEEACPNCGYVGWTRTFPLADQPLASLEDAVLPCEELASAKSDSTP